MSDLKSSLDELNQNIYELFSTRVSFCNVYSCKYHSREWEDRSECRLKSLEITKDGRCEQYDPGGAG